MIVMEFYEGQGLGNQLACYVSTRAIAADRGVEFGIHDPHGCWGDKRYNDKGLYFMDLDLGGKVDESKIQNSNIECIILTYRNIFFNNIIIKDFLKIYNYDTIKINISMNNKTLLK